MDKKLMTVLNALGMRDNPVEQLISALTTQMTRCPPIDTKNCISPACYQCWKIFLEKLEIT
jgi:hypothetical protein